MHLLFYYCCSPFITILSVKSSFSFRSYLLFFFCFTGKSITICNTFQVNEINYITMPVSSARGCVYERERTRVCVRVHLLGSHMYRSPSPS